MSQERKFARTVSKPGMAAQVRVTVAQAVRESTSLTKPKLVEPIDFETFLLKNKTILQNDPQRELVLFPSDDISQEILPQRYRTLVPSVPTGAAEEASDLFVQECIKTYTSNLSVIHYKYNSYGKDYWDLPKGTSKPENLPEQVYELDEENESKDEENPISNGILGEVITKEGILFKCTQSGNESIISLATKSFKRRYAYLRRQVDGTHMLEFCKVDKKNESKGAIYLDFYSAVVKNGRKGKFAFELQLADSGKNCLLAAENENDMEDWINTLKMIILETHNNKVLDRISIAAPPSPSLSERETGTLRESLEQSMNPELVKYARETDQSLSQARKENRQQLFSIYPEMQRCRPENEGQGEKIEPYRERFGYRFIVKCESLNFRLQTRLNEVERGSCQVEPFFTSMALYDVKLGKKISEEFRFDMNNSHMRAMIPRERFSSGDSNHTSNHIQKPSFPDLSNLSEDWLRYPSQGVFSVLRPDSEIYLVVRIEKVLQGSLTQSVDPYLRNGDPKLGLKVFKVAQAFCNRLGHYRMPFGWAAKPVFRPFTGCLDTDPFINTIYKCESSRISDEDLIKFLSDFKKQEKISKLQVIPGQIKLSIEPFKAALPDFLTSSLVPIKPFHDPPTHSLSLEVEEFGPETGSTSYPFATYTNNLYVYPKSLKYDSQKTFTKARNIACLVEFRDCDSEDALPLKRIYGRPGMPVFCTSASAAVLHHNSCPEFYEEVKIALPPQLTDKHHILFTFYHVSCEQAKGPKRREQIETVIGYSWLPVISKGRVNIQEHILTVAAHLPTGYLSCQHLGLGKGFTMPDVRWVDGGKQLFRVELKLASTVYTKDQHIHNFFAHCQRIRSARSPITDSEMCKFLKTLHAVDVNTFIQFTPTILNQLLKLLPYAANEDVSLNIIRVLIHFVNETHVVGKTDVLKSYVEYVFVTEVVNGRNGTISNTVHEELAKSLTVTLRPANADVVIINKFLKHAWFFFGILTKSMAQYLLTTGRIKMYRNERFSPDYQYRIQNLLQALMSHIIQKFKELPEETSHANQSLAKFIKNCFLFMDRGFVFRLINLYLDRYNPGDPKALCELKFEFLRIICSHEYFIPLNLPLCSGSLKVSSKSFKEMNQLYRLSDDFCKNHFLVGSLLQEVKSALNELQDTRKCAISVLRNLLAKHAFDDRYQSKSQQARIVSLYLPFLSIVLENVYRLNNKEGITPCPSMITTEVPTEIPPTPIAHHRHTISLDNSLPAINSLKLNRESSYFALTAGQIANGNIPYLKLGAGSEESLSSDGSSDQNKIEQKDHNDVQIKSKTLWSDFKSHNRNLSQSISQSPLLIRYDKLDQQEVKDLLVCLLYILKNISDELLIGWWQHCSEYDILDFFHVLEICLYTFRYIGKKQICSSNTSNSSKAMTLPARKVPQLLQQRNASMSAKNPSLSNQNEVDAEALYRALLEANMATEVGLITLDVLGLYCNEFKNQLKYQDGDNTIMRKVFDIYISFLQVGQSETLLKHVFAALRAFINKFPEVLFKGNALICGTLCYEILKCCNSRLTTTRHEACALLYLLMRSNFEFANRKNFTRVHLQVIISVSQLLGDIVGLINSRFQESLSLINNYANSDKAMKSSSFPKEVKDLTKRIRTVLMATSQMKEHENDPEMLVDLQYSLANSYASTPELRRTWLESMARIHLKNGDISEAAHCYIHIAALVAEYLKIKGVFPEGCWAFQEISSNVILDESNMKEDSGMQDIHYTEETLLEKLEMCAELLAKAERYEVMSKVYRLIIPIYERQRNFQALSEIYKTLHNAYNKIVELMRTGRRLLGKFYRVAFFGQAYLEDECEKEYVYKEPKITTLSEISDKLVTLYTEKFGKGTVKLIQDSKQVDVRELDPKYFYIQVTHVVPYFTEDELDERITDFEKNNNIDKFMFETPFTLNGRARGVPEEQFERRTILTTAYSFPYVKKRIPVKSRQVYELSPIEVAIDQMETRVGELNDVISTSPPDVKKLQLKLQGSVSVTVNSGPLTYASVFLDEKNIGKYPKDKVRQLKEIYRQFVQACSEALELNGRLVSADQFEYHEAMKKNFKDLVDELTVYLQDKIITVLNDDRATSQNRTSLKVFSYISGTPGSSAV